MASVSDFKSHHQSDKSRLNLVSVIIPCYNQAHYLPEALASVQAQTFPDWECIIVNDGSADDTAAVAQEWVKKDARFRYIEKTNGGLSSARNAGIANAKGELLHFLDADDCIRAGLYEAVVKALSINPGSVAAFCGYQLIQQNGELRHSAPAPSISSDVFHSLLEGNPLPCHAVVIRKSAQQAVGLFNTGLASCEDWDLWLRIASRGGHFVRVEGEFAIYRRSANSMSTNHRVMLTTGLTVIGRNSRLHPGCAKCKRSAGIGRENWRSTCWKQLARSEFEGLIRTKQLGKYLRCWVKVSLYDFGTAWLCLRLLRDYKRLLLQCVLPWGQRWTS